MACTPDELNVHLAVHECDEGLALFVAMAETTRTATYHTHVTNGAIFDAGQGTPSWVRLGLSVTDGGR